jgi:hypothetical protein
MTTDTGDSAVGGLEDLCPEQQGEAGLGQFWIPWWGRELALRNATAGPPEKGY